MTNRDKLMKLAAGDPLMLVLDHQDAEGNPTGKSLGVRFLQSDKGTTEIQFFGDDDFTEKEIKAASALILEALKLSGKDLQVLRECFFN